MGLAILLLVAYSLCATIRCFQLQSQLGKSRHNELRIAQQRDDALWYVEHNKAKREEI